MSFCSNYKLTLSYYDLERYEVKIRACNGVDPYKLKKEYCSQGISLWPKINEVDRLDYFVYRLKFTSKESMKALKANDAHNYFTSGHITELPYVKEVSPERVVLLGTVKHSQSSSLDPLKVWLLAEKDGVIFFGHCTCMAGLGETCSHIGAIVFMVEYSIKKISGMACTDEINKWLSPTLQSVPFKRVRDIYFRSSDSRLTAYLNDPDDLVDQGESVGALAREPCKQINKLFLDNQSQSYRLSAALSLYSEYSGTFVPKELTQDLPKDLSTLWDPNAVGMKYEDLLVLCRDLVVDLGVTENQIKNCEEATRKQADNKLWFQFRLGRITANNMKKISAGNISMPAITTVNLVCYKGKEIKIPAILQGKRWEPVARKVYATKQAAKHTDSSVTECGLSKTNTFIAASPGGIVRCSCCDGVGGIEIKTTTKENLHKCLDVDGQVNKDHSFYYQMQTQIYVCDLKFCDLVLYSGKSHEVHRVFPDRMLHRDMVSKSQQYFGASYCQSWWRNIFLLMITLLLVHC